MTNMSTTPHPMPSPYCPNCKSTVTDPRGASCGACGHVLGGIAAAAPVPALGFVSLPAMRYQNAYVWMVLFSSLDIMLTYLVLFVWRGYEVNPVAAAVIRDDYSGWHMAIIFKFALMLVAVLMCEFVGRMRTHTGIWLSRVSVFLAATPVVYTLLLLLVHGPPED